MHGAQARTDFGNLPRQKGKKIAKRDEHGGKGEITKAFLSRHVNSSRQKKCRDKIPRFVQGMPSWQLSGLWAISTAGYYYTKLTRLCQPAGGCVSLDASIFWLRLYGIGFKQALSGKPDCFSPFLKQLHFIVNPFLLFSRQRKQQPVSIATAERVPDTIRGKTKRFQRADQAQVCKIFVGIHAPAAFCQRRRLQKVLAS